MKHSIHYDTYIRRRLGDTEYAKAYLKASLEAYYEDGDREAFLCALQDIGEVQGKVLELHTLDTVLERLGYRLSLEPIEESVLQSP